MHIEEVVALLRKAIEIVRARSVDVYTFSLYHDHESGALGVCVDTKQNSADVVARINAYSSKHFARCINEGSLKEAALWQANMGRSLSLGDFELVNLARTGIPEGLETGHSFYLTLVNALRRMESEVCECTSSPLEVLFTCSMQHDEVGLVWCRADA